ncbi:unnamed protein product [Lampetra planeri]
MSLNDDFTASIGFVRERTGLGDSDVSSPPPARAASSGHHLFFRAPPPLLQRAGDLSERQSLAPRRRESRGRAEKRHNWLLGLA